MSKNIYINKKDKNLKILRYRRKIEGLTLET